jgi:hypothetical protein
MCAPNSTRHQTCCTGWRLRGWSLGAAVVGCCGALLWREHFQGGCGGAAVVGYCGGRLWWVAVVGCCGKGRLWWGGCGGLLWCAAVVGCCGVLLWCEHFQGGCGGAAVVGYCGGRLWWAAGSRGHAPDRGQVTCCHPSLATAHFSLAFWLFAVQMHPCDC